MRLTSLYIGQYKNLRDFSLSFDGSSFIDVFVGKNGTGKSNLFEALIEIFRHIVEYDRDKNPCDFNYRIGFEIDGKSTEIGWNSGKLTINGKDRKTIGKTALPDNVLIYYSGHNDTVANLVEQYEEAFRKRIKRADFDETRFFLGIGPEYKELLLAVLLMQPDICKARQFICQKLGIETTDPEVRVVLERPTYAADSRFDIELNDETDRYWRPEGITKTFLDRLQGCIKTASGSPVRSEGYFAEPDRYILYFDIVKIREEFSDLSPQELFRQFDNLKTLGMLSEITIPLKLAGGVDATIAHFSDGQFQSVYIYSITELFKDRNCITLLDEPDSFLHPEWQFDFLKQVFEITDTAAKTNHVLMSSHSAVTLIPHERKRVNLFDIHNSKVVCRSTSKDYAISKLSSSLIKYREDEQILSILRNIRIDGAPVLFTEGSTDPDILKEAWQKLYDEPLPFVPIYAFCCDYLRRALQDNRIINEMDNRPLFGVFDFDEAYNEWNYLNQKDTWALQCDDPYLGLRTEHTSDQVYAFLLPVPRIPKVEAQVMKTTGSKEHFAHQSVMGIEHLFYGDQTKQYFEAKQLPGGGEIITFSGNKTKFAKEVVPTLESACFEVFRPMLEFIKSKCTASEEPTGSEV
ncbi:chromosome segregation protein SMC [Candidatus Magnetomorum sp. HK-1]|nr:chromosome segregation protein SMC [Candidatus Magnetomorum sp. HK-1]